ncbi:hypothetical protein Ocin01_17254 [Orchesella cincta]|uniref:Uncharacterized protein n=1 Tax=Orchesella cincta TaxID=48709 RepID=A0A1D2M8V9_ORCCI|nr:hypothetical protein Ocin01_17254 [Orchesella cincta]
MIDRSTVELPSTIIPNIVVARAASAKETFDFWLFNSGQDVLCRVEFTAEEGDTAVVSSTWLRGNDKFCRWPNRPNSNFAKLAANHAKVDDKWTLHPCNVLNTYSSFEKAQRGCTKSVYTSNIESSAAEITSNADLSRRKRRRVTNRKPDKPISPLGFSSPTNKTRSYHTELNTTSALGVEPPRLGLVDPTNYTGNDPQIDLSNIKRSRSPVQTETFQLPVDRQLNNQAQNTFPHSSARRQLYSGKRCFESDRASESSQIASGSSQTFQRYPPPDDVTAGQTPVSQSDKQSAAEDRFCYKTTPTSRYTQGYPSQTTFERLTSEKEDNEDSAAVSC